MSTSATEKTLGPGASPWAQREDSAELPRSDARSHLTDQGGGGGSRGAWGKTVGIVAALVTVVTLMLLAFVTPMINSGAHDLPLAVSGPDAAVTAMTSQLETADPEAFKTTTYDSADEVREAVENREAIGGISLSPDGTVITTAAGAGTPYATMLKHMGSGLEQAGQSVTYQEVAPMTADDPNGAGLNALGLPLVFGGMISGVLLSIVHKNRPVHKILGSLSVSVLGGMAVAGVLQFGFHSTDGNYWLLAGGVALGVAAVSLTILGLEATLGKVGLALGALVMMFVANPLSGMTAGAAWLPQPWGAVGQLLPLGAASTFTRSAAYFDGAGAGAALIVLMCWIVLGLALICLGALRRRATPVSA